MAAIFVDFEHGKKSAETLLGLPPTVSSIFNTPRPGTCGDRRELDFAPLHEAREGPLKPHKAPHSKQIVFSKKPFRRSEVLRFLEQNAADGSQPTAVEGALIGSRPRGGECHRIGCEICSSPLPPIIPHPNRPDQAPGGGVWGGRSISHAESRR